MKNNKNLKNELLLFLIKIFKNKKLSIVHILKEYDIEYSSIKCLEENIIFYINEDKKENIFESFKVLFLIMKEFNITMKMYNNMIKEGKKTYLTHNYELKDLENIFNEMEKIIEQEELEESKKSIIKHYFSIIFNTNNL